MPSPGWDLDNEQSPPWLDADLTAAKSFVRYVLQNDKKHGGLACQRGTLVNFFTPPSFVWSSHCSLLRRAPCCHGHQPLHKIKASRRAPLHKMRSEHAAAGNHYTVCLSIRPSYIPSLPCAGSQGSLEPFPPSVTKAGYKLQFFEVTMVLRSFSFNIEEKKMTNKSRNLNILLFSYHLLVYFPEIFVNLSISCPPPPPP